MIKDIFPERLLQKAKSGELLTKSDKMSALAALKSRTQSTDAHALLRALSISGPPTPELIEIAEEMWKVDDIDWWSQAGIYALCRDWNLSKNYVDWLLDEATVASWQKRPSTGIAALSTIGSMLTEKRNPVLISELLSILSFICEAEALDSEEFWATHLSSLWSAIEQAVYGVEAIWKGQRVTSCGQIVKSTLERAKALAEERTS